ncbi:MAG: VWA domain-containing protein [Verrucomicrobiota bacterium]
MIERLTAFSFGQPFWLFLLLLVPLAMWLRGGPGRVEAVPYSAVSLIRRIGFPVRRGVGAWIRHLGLVALGLSAIAMARPRLNVGESPDAKNGVDIVFCVDVSGSMDSKDFPYKGGMVSKRDAYVMAIGDLVDRRPNDRFGMIGFAGDTYMLSPLTIDGEWIKDVLKEIRLQAWTAIGEGILSSVDLLKDSKARSKIIIVTSDGGNNFGISPLEAAEVAAQKKIRVYTVQFMSPKQVGTTNATSLMGRIAAKTGGMYFQAATLESIVSIYGEIDKLEKTKFKQKQSRMYEELYPWLLTSAFLVLLGGWIGGNTLWLRVP